MDRNEYLVSEFSCNSRQSLIWLLNNIIHWLEKERQRNKIIVRAFPRIMRSQVTFHSNRHPMTSYQASYIAVADYWRDYSSSPRSFFNVVVFLGKTFDFQCLSPPRRLNGYRGANFQGNFRYIWESGMGGGWEKVLTNQIQVASYQ